MKKVRYCVVGCGNIGPLHAESVVSDPNAELIGVCDIIKERADKAHEKYNSKYVFYSFEDVLACDEVDVVNITTPSGMHSDMVVQAAKAGKHCFCEKPMDITKPKIDAMIEACRKYNVKLGCVFQRRLMFEAIAAKKAIEEGKLGTLLLANAELKYTRTQEYYNTAGWRGTWEIDGGGALMNQGVHGVDLIQWVFGDVASVYAKCDTLARDIEVEDTAVALLKFKSGAIGVIQGTTSLSDSFGTTFYFHGSEGNIIFSDEGIIKWDVPGVPEPTGVPFGSASKDPKDIASTGHTGLIQDMSLAVLEDREPKINGEKARGGVELILAIYESSRKNKEVAL